MGARLSVARRTSRLLILFRSREIEIEIDEFGDDGERGNAHMGAIGRASLLGIIIRIQD